MTAVGTRSPSTCARDLVRQQAGRELEALGRPRDARIRASDAARFPAAGRAARDWALRSARRGCERTARREIGFDAQRVGKRGVRQIARIAPLARELREMRAIAAPQQRGARRRARAGSRAPCPRSRRPARRMSSRRARRDLGAAHVSLSSPPQATAAVAAAGRERAAWLNSASKFTGGSRNGGKPPLVSRSEITSRAYGSR